MNLKTKLMLFQRVLLVRICPQVCFQATRTLAVQNCLATVPILDKGIHDFAVSPINGNFYAYDSMTYNSTDVLIEVDSMTNVASCTNIPDPGNSTGVLSSLMFSSQNKLVAIFANQTTGHWIDVSNGTLNALPSAIAGSPFGDGSSLPFSGVKSFVKGGGADLIFANGFEDFIFADGFEGSLPPVACPVF